VNFETELEKLLAGEYEPLPQYELTEVLAEGQALLDALNKKQAELSLQVEEVYDLVKDADDRGLQETLKTERARLQQLLEVAVGLSDMLEHFCVYAGQSGSAELEHQGRLLWQNSQALLESCGITRFGEAGESLNPLLHTVHSALDSKIPKEHIVRVLQSGYGYLGRLLRKAAVVVSRGEAYTEAEYDAERRDIDTEDADIDGTEAECDAEKHDIETEDADIASTDTECDAEKRDIETENSENDNIEKENEKNEQNRWY
jgi:molecular chaperone GrpE (heat shock protein)